MKWTFDNTAFQKDGKDSFFVSGEFHYFRVPANDWKRRMEMFKKAGGNTIATYVPWLIHEPEEGHIVFGDCPERDLVRFLKTAKEVGLGVVLRPGPYQYSELLNAGLPTWLLKNYPEVKSVSADGQSHSPYSISYLHPTFLEKARAYFKAFAEVVRPFMGNPVVMLQTDNELSGIHVWFGTLDVNREAMGIGQEDGRYVKFLSEKYETVEKLNEQYGSGYNAFTEIEPLANVDRSKIGDCRRAKDYNEFYYQTLADYQLILRGWMEEDGLKGPYCHNAAGPQMVQGFVPSVKAMGEGYLLGVDHYYNLNQTWAQNAPTPQHTLRIFQSMEKLRLLGMPPAVLEMPGGTPSDTPPILTEDLLEWYMTHIALGMKGVNYYIYTGGPNFNGTGNTCDVYDYNAFVSADGTKKDTFRAMETVGLFMKKNPWLQRAERRTSVQVAFDFAQCDAGLYHPTDTPFGGLELRNFTEKGVLHALFCSSYAPEMCLLDQPEKWDKKKPLVVPACGVMSEKEQHTLISFVKNGGNVLLIGALPERDENYNPCTLLKDYLGIEKTKVPTPKDDHPLYAKNGKLYQVNRIRLVDNLPAGTLPLVWEEDEKTFAGLSKKDGGKMLWLGFSWTYQLFCISELLETVFRDLGAEPSVISSNRNVWTALREGEGKAMLFLLNPYSGKQETTVTLTKRDGKPFEKKVLLNAMEVKVISL